MKKLKNILAIGCLSVLFGFFLGVSSVSAAEISVNEISGNAGESAVASIAVTPDSGFGAGQFVASFDPTKLEYNGYSIGNALADHEKSSGGLLDVNSNNAGEGKIVFVYISTEDVQEGGALLNLNFKVKEAGATQVNVEVPEFVNNLGSPIGVTVAQVAAITGENGISQQGEDTGSASTDNSESNNMTGTPASEIKKGETVALLHYDEFKVLDATQPITWITSDSKIAEVDATGTIKATGNGKVTVTATQGDKTISYEMDIVGESEKSAAENTNTIITAILIIIIFLVIIGLGVLAFLKIRKNKKSISN
ncbi:cohesin domain-containing protein [Acetobacterium sp.]|uniref:cohesin domain-containing protein n=1 Tax=Acetobacterium sp. TaxID=1872094 RepID=UPI0035947AC4